MRTSLLSLLHLLGNEDRTAEQDLELLNAELYAAHGLKDFVRLSPKRVEPLEDFVIPIRVLRLLMADCLTLGHDAAKLSKRIEGQIVATVEKLRGDASTRQVDVDECKRPLGMSCREYEDCVTPELCARWCRSGFQPPTCDHNSPRKASSGIDAQVCGDCGEFVGRKA